MKSISDPSRILRDPEVQKYFLGVLDSGVPKEEKYDKFVSFFDQAEQLARQLSTQSRAGENIDLAIAEAAQQIGIWNPKQILQRTRDTLQRALQRIQRSQNHDGGWGYKIETSNVWGTTYALMALDEGIKNNLTTPVAGARVKGIGWLMGHAQDWSAADLPPHGQTSVYELAIASRCLCYLGLRNHPPVIAAIKLFMGCQNRDGGWDANIWGKDVSPARVYSEMGATSMVLQALAEAQHRGDLPIIKKAVSWIIDMQNKDGSWNDGSCSPESEKLRGTASIHKTCDALSALMAAKKLGTGDSYEPVVDKAVNWLLNQEKPLQKNPGSAIGWGYDEKGDPLFRPDLESTCLTLEALVHMEKISLPLLTANAQWLMNAQHEQRDSIEDGKWESGDTFRTTFALLGYYSKIKVDPSFQPVAATAPPRKGVARTVKEGRH